MHTPYIHHIYIYTIHTGAERNSSSSSRRPSSPTSFSPSGYIYIYTHIHTYIHTCIHTYIHTYIHTVIRMYIYIYIYIHTNTHTYEYIHTILILMLLRSTNDTAKRIRHSQRFVRAPYVWAPSLS